MSGTRLTNVVELPHPQRWEADVDLADTDMLVNDAARAVPHIAKRFKVPDDERDRRLRRRAASRTWPA
jgi:hypothetical protein